MLIHIPFKDNIVQWHKLKALTGFYKANIAYRYYWGLFASQKILKL